VIGRTHPRFWKHFSAFPVAVQKLAHEKYTLWKEHPHHPRLDSKNGATEFVSCESVTTIERSASGKATLLPGSG